MSAHKKTTLEEFTKQAAGFAAAPQMQNEEALQLLVRCTGAGKEDTVLDVACGPGLVVCAFASKVRQATGIDLVPAMIEKARALQAARGLNNVEWQVGDVRALPWADGAFSIVVSSYAFHHLEQPQAVLAEMKRVCAPGGRVAVADVTAPAEAKEAEAYNQMERLRDPSHVRALPLAEMEGMFASVGLASPRKEFYQIEFELEHLLKGSFPRPGDADRIRQLFNDSMAGDRLGLNVRRKEGEIFFSYPIAVLGAAKPSADCLSIPEHMEED